MEADLTFIEKQLRHRLNFPYEWGRRQNDVWDKYSSFIYRTREWEELTKRCVVEAEKNYLNRAEFFNYSANRWYNFWSAVAVEKIFTDIKGIEPTYNPGNRLVDFNFFGIDFDHKTSVFPKAFPWDIKYAQQNTAQLIHWLYKNQSTQQRHHFGNRLFLLVYAEGGEHWKLKAEISWLKAIIENYVANFEPSKLIRLEFQPGKETFSDIIWAIK